MSKHAPRGRLKAVDPIRDANPMRAPGWRGCNATTRGGAPCKGQAILGGTVCRMHGGAAPQVKAKALERLEAYQDRAIDRLFTLVDQVEYPSVAIAAVKDVLDRTMGKAAETMAITGKDGGPVEFKWQS